MNEESALATIYRNTRRHKRVVDLLTLAECFEFLRSIYPTQEETAKKTDLSREMVREFLQILTLPKFVKDLIKCRKIDSIDTAYRLSKIRDENTLRNLVDKLLDVQTHDVRDIVSSMRENVGLSIDSAKEIVLKNKPRDIHFFIIDFSEKDYRRLCSLAKDIESSPAELIKRIVDNWLRKKDGDSGRNDQRSRSERKH